MLGLDAAGTDIEGGAGKFGDAEKVETDGGADDVDDGVDGADFVEMNFFDGNVVDFGFGFAEAAKDLAGVFGGARGERGAVDHFENVG